MDEAAHLLRALPLEVFDTPQAGDAWERSTLASASDALLIGAAAAAITPPKIRINSSFLLHAPLELLTRAWLLQQLPPGRREPARRRIAAIAARYAAAGPELPSRCAPSRSYADPGQALAELSAALRAGDAGTVDDAMQFLLPRIGPEDFRAALAAQILPALGAAGHAPILLMLLQGAAGGLPHVSALLRAPLRSLALDAHARITWIDTATPMAPEDTTPGLFECLAALPIRIEAASSSIAPTMLAVERDGHAQRMLGTATQALTAPEAERMLLRVAALSMLQDEAEHAPYGWSHCFTIPQAVLSLVDVAPDVTWAVRIAATHVLGFRATLGSAALQLPPVLSGRTARAGGASTPDVDPGAAAAAAFHATEEERRIIRAQLIEHAAAHADAHLGKYTLACLTAAMRDPQQATLYLAAAAYLGAWWQRDGRSGSL